MLLVEWAKTAVDWYVHLWTTNPVSAYILLAVCLLSGISVVSLIWAVWKRRVEEKTYRKAYRPSHGNRNALKCPTCHSTGIRGTYGNRFEYLRCGKIFT